MMSGPCHFIGLRYSRCQIQTNNGISMNQYATDSDNELESGWAFEQYGGGIYHFEHLPMRDAEKLGEQREALYVIETVNWTLADERTVHHNKYFAFGLSGALAVAARMEIEWHEVAEDVVGIRIATMEESATFLNVQAYFDNLMPEAISDEMAGELWGVEDDE